MSGVEVAPIVEVATSTEWEIACERGTRPTLDAAVCKGVGKAEWALWRSCGCNPTYLLHCTACKDKVIASEALYCTTCDTSFEPGSTAYSLIEPLNGPLS